jgi:hypothetical protein
MDLGDEDVFQVMTISSIKEGGQVSFLKLI